MSDITKLNIFSKKTKRARASFVKQATFYLKKLKEEQENKGIISPYVFPSPLDVNKPITKNSVCLWFRKLTQKALGRKLTPHITRHSRATELYEKAEKGQFSKDTAIKVMGHSKDMSKVYTHLSPSAIKEVMTSIYKLEDLPKDKKEEMTIMLKELMDRVKLLENQASINHNIRSLR